ncbi:hypothetical protein [Cellulomonas hominis]|uniref:hypothetical protein n=1 Tax=Cellulomonas hominis TaxID=156981 RepID=UPI001B8E38CA|nr:hypothetical protein [Cellulomonas hominis]VTR75779.1 hypothetical protein CHMI_00532 [Cellulomonas hominis]
MTEVEQDVGPGPRNTLLYWITGAILAVLTVVALIAYRGAQEDEAASAKADELLVVLEEAGVERLPDKDQVVRVLGDDGGSVCQDPGHALRQATLFSMLTNGATGPGMRPVIADSRLVRGQLAVMSVYCPDEIEDVRQWLDDLPTDDHVRG